VLDRKLATSRPTATTVGEHDCVGAYLPGTSRGLRSLPWSGDQNPMHPDARVSIVNNSHFAEEDGVAGPLDRLALEARPSPALAATVVPAIRRLITSGALPQGSHLRESELAAALRMSRGPVREALVELEREGLVVLRRHRGAQVITLTAGDAEEVYTLRVALERLAVERAVPRLRREDLAEMDELLDRMRHLGPDYSPELAVHLDLAFHDVLFRAAAHSRLDRAHQQIRSQVAMFLRARHLAERDFHEIAYPEHRGIRDTVARGDVAGSVALMEKHLVGAYHRLTAAGPREVAPVD
jgi:DNA-binding GntR family transcriptional regulator